MADTEVLGKIPTEQESMDDILKSEAGILECMADLFCGEYQGGHGVSDGDIYHHKTGIVPYIKSINDEIERKAELVKQILCSFACKECAIAEVIEAIADKTVVINDVIEPHENCSCCKCK